MLKKTSDHTRPFALVLVQADNVTDTPLGHFGHLGVAFADREEIDRKTGMAELMACYAKSLKMPENLWVITFSSQTLMVILWSFLMDNRLDSKQSEAALPTNQTCQSIEGGRSGLTLLRAAISL